MDDDEFPTDDEIDFDYAEDDGAEECAVRVVRVTLRDGRLWLTAWHPGLAEGGPMSALLRAREREGVAIADLRLFTAADGTREIVVEYMAAGPTRESADAALIRWAADVGHDRLWLPDGPVDLAPHRRASGTASVRCPACDAEWVDATPSFWEEVRGLGHFPAACPICGGALPQWEVTAEDLTRCRGGAVDAAGWERGDAEPRRFIERPRDT